MLFVQEGVYFEGEDNNRDDYFVTKKMQNRLQSTIVPGPRNSSGMFPLFRILMGTILGMICQVSIADQNIHIVSKEQMRKRKQMLYKEFLK